MTIKYIFILCYIKVLNNRTAILCKKKLPYSIKCMRIVYSDCTHNSCVAIRYLYIYSMLQRCFNMSLYAKNPTAGVYSYTFLMRIIKVNKKYLFLNQHF